MTRTGITGRASRWHVGKFKLRYAYCVAASARPRAAARQEHGTRFRPRRLIGFVNALLPKRFSSDGEMKSS
jgi:hypothetical protein